MIHEDPAHGLCKQRPQVRRARRIRARLARQAQKCLVNQRRWLQRVTAAFAPHEPLGNLPQLGIDGGRHLLRLGCVALCSFPITCWSGISHSVARSAPARQPAQRIHFAAAHKKTWRSFSATCAFMVDGDKTPRKPFKIGGKSWFPNTHPSPRDSSAICLVRRSAETRRKSTRRSSLPPRGRATPRPTAPW